MNRRIHATLLGIIFLSSIWFTACGSGSSSMHGSPAVSVTSGTPQSTAVDMAFASPLTVTVTTGGSATSGVVVTFTAPTSGASGTFAGGTTTATATSNASGVATSPVFTANSTTGAYSVTATATGASSAASFSLTNTVAIPASIVATTGTPQSAEVNAPFAAPLVATVADSNSNPISGVVVTFTAPSAGASGSFAGGVTTATTDVNGIATSPVFTANGTVGGPYNVTASISGVTTPATFSLTNTVDIPTAVIATSGTPQSASVNNAFALPLTVTVLDVNMNPVVGAMVTFAAPSTGASGTFAGGVNSALTNASGVATSATFTANGTAGGPYTVSAAVVGVVTTANFILTNLVAVPATISATLGTPQSAAINTAFALPLTATVLDAASHPINGAIVTFTAPSTGASGTFAGGVTTATTNVSGVATSAVFTANSTAGSYSVSASVAGVSTPATFSLTNNAGAAASIAATLGTPQSAAINTAFALHLVATVLDSGSNPISGATVTFTAPSTGASGTFAGGVNTAVTNASGIATSGVFTANATAGGPYSVTASVAGVSTPATFSLTNLAGAAASIAATSGTPQSATVNTAFAAHLVATVLDSGSNPISGAVVTFTAPSTGASGTFAGGVNTATTNASGVATSATFTANGTAGGPYSVSASVAGVSSPAVFSLTNTAGAAASIAATSGTPQTTVVSTAFALPLVATVLDAASNPISGATVTFTAPSSGAGGTFAGGVNTATTNASGVATSAIFTANSTAGSYSVSASVAGVSSPATFSLTNTAGAAASIAATSGTPQTTNVSTVFAAPLVATVLDSGSNPVSGVTVTFTAPSSGASVTFAGGVNTAVTDSNGVATSTVITANATAGGPYNVVATVTGVSTPANFSLTNTLPSTSYSFYMNGLESINGGPNFYALAGSVSIDTSGNVLTGVQDYNDGVGTLSPQPSGDSITGGTMTIDPTSGQGTLVLITNNPAVGVAGTETFAVEFVNTNHALITQFDGTATSSGAMDLQTLPSTLSGNFAFTFSGLDENFSSVVYGGVFTIQNDGVTLLGTYDVDDMGTSGATPTRNVAFSATASQADSFGRGTITGSPIATNLNYYVVGPKVIRIVAMDPAVSSSTGNTGTGSAFSQGAGSFSDAAIGSSVFGMQSNPSGVLFAATGMWTVPSSGIVQGVADDNEVNASIVLNAAPITGIYSIASNGYGSMTLAPGDLGSISSLGIYVTDPTLNLIDPNNTTSGLGGALIADLDGTALNGTGILLPQTDTATASFNGNYAFNSQAYIETGGGWEFDYAGQGSISSLNLTATGVFSDPFKILNNATTDPGMQFLQTAGPDLSNPGRYANEFVLLFPSSFGYGFDMTTYQANGGQLVWMETDGFLTTFGFFEQQGSLTGVPAIRKAHKFTKTRAVKNAVPASKVPHTKAPCALRLKCK